MNTIRFRAWDKERGQYAKVLALEFNEATGEVEMVKAKIGGDAYFGAGKRFELERYIGVKDESGKEIHEGDIVHDAYCAKPFRVTYRNLDCSFVGVSDDREVIVALLERESEQYEIIGNVHQNPELVELMNPTL